MEKLSKERFKEILKLVIESPDKLIRGISKIELISFAQEIAQQSKSEAETEDNVGKIDEITQLKEELLNFQEKLKAKEGQITELMRNMEESSKNLKDSEDRIESLNYQYREILPRVNKYRIWCIILLVAVILQWIF